MLVHYGGAKALPAGVKQCFNYVIVCIKVLACNASSKTDPASRGKFEHASSTILSKGGLYTYNKKKSENRAYHAI